MNHNELAKKLTEGPAVFGVIGLGYVGLPLALEFAEAGIRVVGFDIDPAKVAYLRKGESYIRQIPASRIKPFVDGGLLEATGDLDRLGEVDVIAICVPTPLDGHRQPDLSFVEITSRDTARRLKKGQVVILESTTYPGTTREVVLPILEEGSGLKGGTDFFLAFSPEREDPGNKDYRTRTIPKVIGALTPAGLELAKGFYDRVFERTVPVSSLEVAEMTKIFENTFRAVNIALVNELKMLALRMGVNLHEVIDAASTKPFGFMPFRPGPGLGGHCIPIDPFYLTWKAHEYEFSTRFIELAGEINTGMPRFVVERTAEALNHAGKPLRGSKILILGISYKPDIDDMRESPAVPVMEGLLARGAKVDYHDPYIAKMPATRQTDLRLESIPLKDYSELKAYDAVVIVTNHSDYNYREVVRNAALVVDTRNATAGIPDDGNVWLA
ncbi:MAG: UDP-N-acetyl-D-glucosamine dehydrogenase [Candidatus Coatesbacteria bacterium RBG_13_66_14]|uniref:UDP-N-acetyl-D-glucosamine dehydrogenase n=1 Tax=Candidatus Coatesbacteria bacterium RBG_13_66_14 TaxID=1817816 RepID=A0A1F5FFV0_9BACT|nr:MAG: UDP-N-acetyl-D-glucosamine dehydrogenase [Candidatus Coatesbacteria bacterium RBG_13_66_14]